MRILTLSNCLLHANEGSGQVILSLTQGLRQRGHDVDLYGPDDYEICRGLRPRANAYRQALGMWRFARARLREYPYDLLEIYGGEGWLTFLALARQKTLRPLLVAHSNGLEPHVRFCLKHIDHQRRRWWQLDHSPWMARGFRCVDGLVVVSDFDREFALRQSYQPEDNLVTVKPGLAPEFLGLPLNLERQAVIGYCGNWLPIKGIDLIARALPQIMREFTRVKLLLVGVGNEFRITDWFPADVTARIEAIPWLDRRADLIAQYQRMAIAIRPSYYESFGLAAAEAMACGAAVISSQGGFGGALRHGKDGLVLNPLNADSLAAACRQLLSDDALRQRIAAAGRLRVQSLRWEHSITRLAHIYERWLAQHKRRAFN